MGDAGVLKKYTSGMWLVNYGSERNVTGVPATDETLFCGVHINEGDYFLRDWAKNKADNDYRIYSIPTVYRCEILEIPKLDKEGKETGEYTYKKVYEPARYARFA
jgi:hypothetical protein